MSQARLEDGAVIVKIFKSTKFKIQNSMESHRSKKKKKKKRKKKKKKKFEHRLIIDHCKPEDGVVELR